MTLTKTSYFKQAEEMAKHFHYYVNKCIRELKVVNFYMDLKINYQELKAFSDYYLTDLYDDICDKKRIFNIIEKINKGYELVNVMISDLSLQKEDYLQQLIQLEGKKRALLK